MIFLVIKEKGAALILTAVLLGILHQGLGDQCTIHVEYKHCTKDVKMKSLVFTQELVDVEYERITCRCGFKIQEMGYEYFAMQRETDKKVACFVLKNISTSKRNIFSVLDELKNLRSQSTCSQSCDPNGCIQLGTEPYFAVYKAISDIVTLPSKTDTTIETILLSSSTQKPFIRPTLGRKKNIFT